MGSCQLNNIFVFQISVFHVIMREIYLFGLRARIRQIFVQFYPCEHLKQKDSSVITDTQNILEYLHYLWLAENCVKYKS